MEQWLTLSKGPELAVLLLLQGGGIELLKEINVVYL
jgi:hypothetical protein